MNGKQKSSEPLAFGSARTKAQREKDTKAGRSAGTPLPASQRGNLRALLNAYVLVEHRGKTFSMPDETVARRYAYRFGTPNHPVRVVQSKKTLLYYPKKGLKK